jgi:hypothetical protein
MATTDTPREQATEATGAQETGFWQPYSEFAKTLRTWFVGYGVGAPAVVLTQADLRLQLGASGMMAALAWFFFAGVLLQVLLAWVYKAAMWQLYLGETDEDRRNSRWYRSANAISEATWVEVVVDLATIVSFTIATFIAFAVIGK